MLTIILTITIFQIVFFLAILATKKQKTSFEKCIIAWGIGLFFHVFFSLLAMNTDGELKKCFNYIALGFVMIHGPFIYLSTNSLISPSKKFSFTYILYFLPFIVMVFLGFLNNFKPIDLINILVYFIFIFLSIRKLKRYKHYMTDHFSNTEKLNLKWLRILLYGQFFFFVTSIFSSIILRFYNIHFNAESFNEYLYTITVFLFVNLLCFTGIKRTPILIHQPVFDMVKKDEKSEIIQEENHTRMAKEQKKEVYSNSGLKEQEALVFSQKLKKYMEEHQPYKNSGLTLKDLAEAVETYPHYLTQILNSTLQQNFYDFINTYRVEEAKKLLVDDGKNIFTILSIAYDCGFSSKSSFNRIFKQKTGFTPTEFKQKTDEKYI